MAYRDFREFIAAAEQQGLLRRVRQTVDLGWEPACLAKWAFQALSDEARFGLLFDDVAGSEMPLVIGALGASTAAYALGLGVTPDEIQEKWVEALRNPVPPKTVDAAPCHDVVLTGDDVRLSDLPIPTWTPDKDPAPYLTTIVVTRDADTGAQNMGVYRTMVRDEQSVVVNLSPGRHGFMQACTYLDKGRPAPIAWIIASEPVVHFATVANMPFGADEIDVAGGLKGAPVEMVQCKTSEIMVPANSEIIIEGEVVPGETDLEGPFGEFAGYMGPVAQKPVARITAITHRRDAIFYGYTSQMPPSESTVLQSLANAPLLLKTLRDDLGEGSIHDVYIDLTFGGLLAHGIVAMKTGYRGHARKVGRLIADLTPLKRITLVDEHVDIRDPLHIEWAMNSHYSPIRDTILIDEVYFPMGMDPSVSVDSMQQDVGSKVVIDATQTVDAGEFSLPPRDRMMKALETWKAAGLPEFEIPKRARLRIDRS